MRIVLKKNGVVENIIVGESVSLVQEFFPDYEVYEDTGDDFIPDKLDSLVSLQKEVENLKEENNLLKAQMAAILAAE